MSIKHEGTIIAEIKQLRCLEGQLQRRWSYLARTRGALPASFLSSLEMLKSRVARLEILLDGETPEWKKAA
jgi:hypothetical protein